MHNSDYLCEKNMCKRFILLLVLFISTTAFGQWNQYPYYPSNSLISFPLDEGMHNEEPIEWWYTNAHFVGLTTGHEYSMMLTYFAFDSLGFDGFRILNLKDETTNEFNTSTEFLTFSVMATDHLEIEAKKFGSNTEYWYTKKDSVGNLLPFQYHIEANSLMVGEINLDMNMVKPPLIVADSGYLDQGIVNYTYYYSQTGMNVTGAITFGSTTEAVQGTGWIDRQYGSFNPDTGEAYEWFCLQLSNGMDINLWNIFDVTNTIPENNKYRIASIYIDENTSKTISDFEITRPKFAYANLSGNCYANEWHFTSDSLDIDLVISLASSNDEVPIPFKFLEGSTSITGTINGDAVTGKGFAELLHRYYNPDMNFVAPVVGEDWNSSIPLKWTLANPDEGRPIQYDVYYSTDQSTFVKMVEGISDTTFLMDATSLDPDAYYWFKVVGYSVDHTLTDSIVTENSFLLSPSSISNLELAQKISLGPNPTQDFLDFKCNYGAGELELISQSGKRMGLSKSFKKDELIQLDVRFLPKGSYWIKVLSNGVQYSKPWVKI